MQGAGLLRYVKADLTLALIAQNRRPPLLFPVGSVDAAPPAPACVSRIIGPDNENCAAGFRAKVMRVAPIVGRIVQPLLITLRAGVRNFVIGAGLPPAPMTLHVTKDMRAVLTARRMDNRIVAPCAGRGNLSDLAQARTGMIAIGPAELFQSPRMHANSRPALCAGCVNSFRGAVSMMEAIVLAVFTRGDRGAATAGTQNRGLWYTIHARTSLLGEGHAPGGLQPRGGFLMPPLYHMGASYA
jgi:hypothetical protein